MQSTGKYEQTWQVLYAIDRPLIWAEDDDDSTDSDSQVGSDSDAIDDNDGDSDNDSSKTFSAAYVKNLRKENAAARIKAKETNEELTSTQAKLREREQADMTDVEKMRSDLEAAQAALETITSERDSAATSLKSERINSAVIVKATSLGFNDPSDALSMIDVDELVDDEGVVKPKAVIGALEKLAKQKPYLVGSGKGSGDGGVIGSKPADSKSPEALEAKYAEHFKQRGRVSV